MTRNAPMRVKFRFQAADLRGSGFALAYGASRRDNRNNWELVK
jgi:hypothetical protein